MFIGRKPKSLGWLARGESGMSLMSACFYNMDSKQSMSMSAIQPCLPPYKGRPVTVPYVDPDWLVGKYLLQSMYDWLDIEANKNFQVLQVPKDEKGCW